MRPGCIGAIASGLLLCAAAADAAEPPLTIGVLEDMSGVYSDITGPPQVVAAQMAVDDFGGTVLGRPMELLLTGRRVYGPEAARIGLVTRSVPAEALEATLGEIADGVDCCSAPAVRRMKRFKAAAEGMNTRDAMAEAVHSISAGLLEEDTRQRIAAFLDRPARA